MTFVGRRRLLLAPRSGSNTWDRPHQVRRLVLSVRGSLGTDGIELRLLFVVQ